MMEQNGGVCRKLWAGSTGTGTLLTIQLARHYLLAVSNDLTSWNMSYQSVIWQLLQTSVSLPLTHCNLPHKSNQTTP